MLFFQHKPLKHALFHVQVIYFTDALDEYLMQHLTEYEDKKLQDASKENLKIGGKESKAKTKELAKTYKKLTKWWKDLLNNENLEAVKVTLLQPSHINRSWIHLNFREYHVKFMLSWKSTRKTCDYFLIAGKYPISRHAHGGGNLQDRMVI